MAIAGYVFICFVFGTTFLAIKMGLNEGIPPMFMAAIRFGLAGVVLLPYLWINKVEFPRTIRQWAEIALLGFLMTTIPFAALFWAEQHMTSGMASLLVATSPLFVGILGRMDRYQIIGLFISFAGLLLVVCPELIREEGVSHSIWAMLSIVLSEMAFAYGIIRSKKVLTEDVSPQMFNAVQMIFASVMLLALSIASEQPSSTSWSSNLIWSIVYLSIMASVIASGIYYWLIKVTNPMFPTTWTIVSPIIAVFAGAWFLHEPLTWMVITGTIITILGIVIVNRAMFLKK